MTLPLDAMICASKDQVSTTTGADVVILELTDGTYYGLNEVGQTVWDLIKTPIKVGAIVDQISDTYDVQPDVCLNDLQTLFGSLLEHKLIQVQDASGT